MTQQEYLQSLEEKRQQETERRNREYGRMNAAYRAIGKKYKVSTRFTNGRKGAEFWLWRDGRCLVHLKEEDTAICAYQAAREMERLRTRWDGEP
jgi:serine/threonine protein phosphatase PrpC